MTKKEWRKAFKKHFGTDSFMGEIWKSNRNYLMFSGPNLLDCEWNALLTDHQREYLMDNCEFNLVCCDAPQPCSPRKPMSLVYAEYFNHMINPPLMVQEKEKDTAMYPTPKTTSMPTVTDLTINMAPAASASVNSKSDVQIQREHLLNRLRGIEDDYRWGYKSDSLREAFNLDADNTPKTARQLIEVIKGGKFKLDERIADLQDKGNHYDPVSDDYIQTPLSALTFDGPTPDKDGYTKARETIQALLKDAKDTIIVKSPEDGLTAIQALEAWTPTGKAN